MKRFPIILLASATLSLAACSTSPYYVPVNTASAYGTAAPGEAPYIPPQDYGTTSPYYPYDQYTAPYNNIYQSPEVEMPYYDYYGIPEYDYAPYYPYYNGYFGGAYFAPSFRGFRNFNRTHDFNHTRTFDHGSRVVTPSRNFGSSPPFNHGWSAGRVPSRSPASRTPHVQSPAMHAAPSFHGSAAHTNGGAHVSSGGHASGGRR